MKQSSENWNISKFAVVQTMSWLTMIRRRRVFFQVQKANNWKEADTVLIHIRVLHKQNFLSGFLRQCKAFLLGECLMNLRYPFNLQLTYNICFTCNCINYNNIVSTAMQGAIVSINTYNWATTTQSSRIIATFTLYEDFKRFSCKNINKL